MTSAFRLSAAHAHARSSRRWLIASRHSLRLGFRCRGSQPDRRQQALEVVLVNAKSKTQPAIADAQAQHNLDGGGNTDQKRRAQSPLPVMPEQKPDAEVKLALRRVEQLEREARQVMTQAQSQDARREHAAAEHRARRPSRERRRGPSAADIMQRSLEIARLEAKISRDWDAYQQRPRRRFVGARTQEYRFARYVEDWRQKIERVGDLNYPQARARSAPARQARRHGRDQGRRHGRRRSTSNRRPATRSSTRPRGASCSSRRPFAAFPPPTSPRTSTSCTSRARGLSRPATGSCRTTPTSRLQRARHARQIRGHRQPRRPQQVAAHPRRVRAQTGQDMTYVAMLATHRRFRARRSSASGAKAAAA